MLGSEREKIMNTVTETGFRRHSSKNLPGTVLGPSLDVWHRIQSEQDKIVRFSGHTKRFGHRIRWQNGYEHQCSVTVLCTEFLIRLRPYVTLDELLVTRCFLLHDIPEGLLQRDILAPLKKKKDDVDEYLAFKKLFQLLGTMVWSELERAFLLQFALDDNNLFPSEALAVMADLRKNRRNEALAFDGIQSMDYIYYAEECCDRGDVSVVLEEVVTNQWEKMNRIATLLPGFPDVVWTPERRKYFSKYLPGAKERANQ